MDVEKKKWLKSQTYAFISRYLKTHTHTQRKKEIKIKIEINSKKTNIKIGLTNLS